MKLEGTYVDHTMGRGKYGCGIANECWKDVILLIQQRTGLSLYCGSINVLLPTMYDIVDAGFDWELTPPEYNGEGMKLKQCVIDIFDQPSRPGVIVRPNGSPNPSNNLLEVMTERIYNLQPGKTTISITI